MVKQGTGQQSRRVLAYLDAFIEYIGASLLQTEITLKHLRGHPPGARASNRQRDEWKGELQNALVHWGRVSHAVEDFYFHSNFVEFAFLRQIVGSGADSLALSGYSALPTVSQMAELHKRKLYRRARAPHLDRDAGGKSILSARMSEMAKFVFTGMFDKDDVLYSFSDGLEGIATYFEASQDTNDRLLPAQAARLKDLDSALLSHIFDPKKRRTLVKLDGEKVVTNEKAIDSVNEQHLAELRADKLARNAAAYGGANSLFATSIHKASQIDLVQAIESPLKGFSMGMILLTLASNVEAAERNAQKVAQAMNDAPRDEYYLASNNSNTEESVGTHTLMAKDSKRKTPLRDEADQYARFAVAMVTDLMATQVTQEQSSTQTIDWADLVRRLLCHPAQAPDDWAVKFLKSQLVPSHRTFQPKLLSNSDAQSALRDGIRNINNLQQAYTDLYLEARAEWDHLVD